MVYLKEYAVAKQLLILLCADLFAFNSSGELAYKVPLPFCGSFDMDVENSRFYIYTTKPNQIKVYDFKGKELDCIRAKNRWQ